MGLSDAEKRARSRRLRRFAVHDWIVRVGSVVALLAVVGAVVWWARGRAVDPLRRRAIASACQAAYQRATSAADSARVDQQEPVIDRLSALARISCGELRRNGAVVP